MKKIFAVLALGLAGVMGCEMKSGTAPSTNPSDPGAVRKLTVVASESHTITQNETDEIKVTVTRDNFKEPVTLEIADLPKGISIDTKDMEVPADQNVVTLRIKAAPDAPPITDHVFHLSGKSKDVKSPMLNLKLTVKGK